MSYEPRKPMSWDEVAATTPNEAFTAEVREMQRRMEERKSPWLYDGPCIASDETQRLAYELHANPAGLTKEEPVNKNGAPTVTDEEALRIIHDIRRAAHDEGYEKGPDAINTLLDALGEALSADLEQGAHWMNNAQTQEFHRKYPRFTTLFNVARHVDWNKV